MENKICISKGENQEVEIIDYVYDNYGPYAYDKKTQYRVLIQRKRNQQILGMCNLNKITVTKFVDLCIKRVLTELKQSDKESIKFFFEQLKRL